MSTLVPFGTSDVWCKAFRFSVETGIRERLRPPPSPAAPGWRATSPWHNTIQYNTTQHNTTQYNTPHYFIIMCSLFCFFALLLPRYYNILCYARLCYIRPFYFSVEMLACCVWFASHFTMKGTGFSGRSSRTWRSRELFAKAFEMLLVSLSLSIYIYIYIHTYTSFVDVCKHMQSYCMRMICVYMYIIVDHVYMCIHTIYVYTYICVYIYIIHICIYTHTSMCIYIYTHIDRERERERERESERERAGKGDCGFDAGNQAWLETGVRQRICCRCTLNNANGPRRSERVRCNIQLATRSASLPSQELCKCPSAAILYDIYIYIYIYIHTHISISYFIIIMFYYY